MAVLNQFYETRDGDVLDAIAFDHYGSTASGQLEAVLAANPGIAALGAVLDAGVRIVLPDLSDDDTTSEALQLWD